MEVIKVSVQNIEQVQNIVKSDIDFYHKAFILIDDTAVYRFFDHLQLDGDAIYRICIAKEIPFNYPCEIKDKLTNEILLSPRSLSELVEFIDPSQCKHLRLIIHCNDKEFLASVMQQLLYLDIDIDIMLAYEERQIKYIDEFRANLCKITAICKEALNCLRYSICESNLKNSLIDFVEQLQEALVKTLQLDMKVAVMALKKSGKSAFVNCLLDAEYSPTSLELATFASCIYKKSKDKIISLSYKDNIKMFNSAFELKRYLSSEYKALHYAENKHILGDLIEIQYVSDSENNYTIIDTPGPDLAGTYHKEIAYRWIKEADVIVFIIDYTKHLTDIEEQFFKDIKSVFEEHGKFYSFIVAVNKLDMMYMSEEKKSAIRFIDYLSYRLKTLGYKGFVVFGISALQYINSLIAPTLPDCECLLENEPQVFRECLHSCLKKYQAKDEITILSYIDSQIRNLKWFHMKEDAVLSDIIQKSSVQKLKSYINYIAMEKAHFEAFHHRLLLVHQKIEEFYSLFIQLQLSSLYRETDEIDRQLNEITLFFDTFIRKISATLLVADFKDTFRKNTGFAQKTLSSNISMNIEQLLKDVQRLLKHFDKAKIATFIKGDGHTEIEKLNYSIDKSIVEKNYQPVIAKYMADFNNKIMAIEGMLNEDLSRLNSKLREFQKIVEIELRQFQKSISLPKLGAVDLKIQLSDIEIRYNHIFTHSLIKERLTRKRGFLGSIIYILTFGSVNVRTGNFTFDDIKIKKALFILKKALADDTATQLNALHESLDKKIDEQYNTITQAINNIKEFFVRDINDISKAILSELNNKKETLLHNAQAIKEVEQRLQLIKAHLKT